MRKDLCVGAGGCVEACVRGGEFPNRRYADQRAAERFEAMKDEFKEFGMEMKGLRPAWIYDSLGQEFADIIREMGEEAKEVCAFDDSRLVHKASERVQHRILGGL